MWDITDVQEEALRVVLFGQAKDRCCHSKIVPGHSVIAKMLLVWVSNGSG